MTRDLMLGPGRPDADPGMGYYLAGAAFATAVNAYDGAHRAVSGGIEVAHQAVDGIQELRYARLSGLLKGLREGTADDLLRELSVGYSGVAAGVEVDLYETPYREDAYPLDGFDATESWTRTTIDAHWGDEGVSKMFATAHQTKKREGQIAEADYRCNAEPGENDLHLGSLLHVARVAREMQKNQDRKQRQPRDGRITSFVFAKVLGHGE